MARFRRVLLSLLAVAAVSCSGDKGGSTDTSGVDWSPYLVPPDAADATRGADEQGNPDAHGKDATQPDATDGLLPPPDVWDLFVPPPDGTVETPTPEVAETVEEAETACIADCSGKQCGPDGCGGDCGVCPPPENLCAGYLKCILETGQCELDPETVVTCADNPDPCLDDACDSNTGKCEPLAADDGLPCDDGDAATTGDQCQAGACVGKKPLGFCDEYTDNFNSLKQFPPDHTLVDFEAIEKCTACPCCNPDGTYPWSGPDVLGCMKCELEGYLAQWGITKVGGMTSTMVFCISGNEDAPMANKVVFVGADFMPAPGKYAVQLNLAQGVLAFGLSSVPSASNSDPVVTLRGYDAAGNQVGYDQFSYEGNPPSGCEGTNPVVSFFGFRACGGSPMVKIVAEYTNPNVTIDHLVFHPPLE
jgi:hypothetical protein